MSVNSILREAAANPIWQEEDGRLLVDITTAPLPGVHTRPLSYKGIWNEWVEQTAPPGARFFRWGGPDLKWNPGSGILRFRFHIRQAGRYLIALRNRHDGDADNDCFLRVDGGQWWRATGRRPGDWSWDLVREAAPQTQEPYAEDFDAGFHQIEISGRSHGFCIDRLAVTREGVTPDDRPSAVRPR